MKVNNVRRELRKHVNPKKAEILQRFFKTGKGQYGEGDTFLGVVVPKQRKIAKQYSNLPMQDVLLLLKTRIHEYRLTALLILVEQYQNGSPEKQEKIFRTYLSHTKYINNWDLVDVTTPKIVGAHLYNAKRDALYTLANSSIMWERRIAILATHYFIRKKDTDYTFAIATILLKDDHDLIHKAVGWMLREAGKVDKKQLISFLDRNATAMPRTMLRYAIEKFPEEERKAYLAKK